ncbi:hypothetical protein HDU83_006032 [Entophlyctis luteolus]|nr:hypothetical protein HDU83_006032 [Entophlyctis luteolus]
MSTSNAISAVDNEHKEVDRLKLCINDTTLPSRITSMWQLTTLDLSGSRLLSSLPSTDDMQHLTTLRTAFFSDCAFNVFPASLSACRALQMVAFRNNNMTVVPRDSFPPLLRWLILTNNRISEIPAEIGNCHCLEKVMLAGNCLSSLPTSMSNCRKLALLRISANKFSSIPDWLLRMPSLAFLAFAGNPCSPPSVAHESITQAEWKDIVVEHTLGTGASGVISQARWRDTTVALKLFKSAVTSDGLPRDEMAASIAAGIHPSLITPVAAVTGHPEGTHGLILPLVPLEFVALGGPPNFDTCSRDVFASDRRMSLSSVVRILSCIAGAACHIHARGVSHGDLYAHNILVNSDGLALLGDFGAACLYEKGSAESAALWERLEVLAFAHLIEDLVNLVDSQESSQAAFLLLKKIHADCANPSVGDRPSFQEIFHLLKNTKE